MGVPPGQSELSPPANLLSIQSEVLCYPLYRQGGSAKLARTELATETLRKETESNSSLCPRVSPGVALVVVYFFIWEGALVLLPFKTTCRLKLLL